MSYYESASVATKQPKDDNNGKARKNINPTPHKEPTRDFSISSQKEVDGMITPKSTVGL